MQNGTCSCQNTCGTVACGKSRPPFPKDAKGWGTRQEEYALKETFIGLPIYATFVVLDESEKDEKGTPKLCILELSLSVFKTTRNSWSTTEGA